MEIRDLTAHDTRALEQFTCRVIGQPWSQIIDEMITDKLAYSIEVGETVAIGAWQNDSLIGVAAWRAERRRWHVAVLAVATGAKRHGIGSALKSRVLDLARSSGVEAVTSYVDWNNEAML